MGYIEDFQRQVLDTFTAQKQAEAQAAQTTAMATSAYQAATAPSQQAYAGSTGTWKPPEPPASGVIPPETPATETTKRGWEMNPGEQKQAFGYNDIWDIRRPTGVIPSRSELARQQSMLSTPSPGSAPKAPSTGGAIPQGRSRRRRTSDILADNY